MVALTGLAVAALPVTVMARENFSGRFFITYQNSERARERREYLSERFEATLRDRVFERNDLAITFYLDNARDLSADETIRRYRGMLNLQNPYYTFNARYTPRQSITALELPGGIEILDKDVMLDVHPPSLPRVRLSYGQVERFAANVTGNKTTNVRGDINYTYRMFSAMLNRYVSTSENAIERETTVTGGDLRAAHTFGPQFTFDVGYQYQLTEIQPTPGLPTDVTNNSFTGIFTSQYRRLVLGNVILNRRYLTNESAVSFKTTDDNHRVSAMLFPFSPVTLELSDTYLRALQDDRIMSKTNYGTAQMIATGTIWRKTRGLAQLTRQVEIETINGIVPDHIYFVRLESFDRRGFDMRAEAGVYERVQDETRDYKYRNTTLFDIYLRPRRDLTLVPRATFTKFSDTVSFTGNDQLAYGLNGTWTARYVNFGMNLTHNEITTGRRSVSNAAAFNMSARLRSRASFNVSYGIRETDQFATRLVPWNYDKSQTWNLWGQVWVLPRGSVSVNYTHVDRDPGEDTNYVAVNYRQEF
jgi:hypothetical protein